MSAVGDVRAIDIRTAISILTALANVMALREHAVKICRLVFLAISLLFLNSGITRKVHAQDGQVKLRVSTTGQGVDWVNTYDVPVTDSPKLESGPTTNAGLTIVPTFAANVDAATQTVINNVLAFYQNTFSDNLTVHIEFHNMNSGLGQSNSWIYTVTYSSYRSALAADAKTTDDATALANTPAGSTNPVTSSTHVDLTSPAGRAVGLNTAELQFSQGSS
jgi:hypothetical protein